MPQLKLGSGRGAETSLLEHDSNTVLGQSKTTSCLPIRLRGCAVSSRRAMERQDKLAQPNKRNKVEQTNKPNRNKEKEAPISLS